MGVSRYNKEYEIFFRENFPSVYIFMKRYTGDADLAADLSQETFVRVFEQGDNLVLGECGRAYLYTVARHLYWHHCRHRQVEESYASSLNENEESDYDFLKEVTQRETIRILYAAIEKLPPRTRQIIRLNLEGKSNAEVAQILRISLNTVKDLKKTAYTALRDLLSNEYLLILLWLVGE